MKKMVIPFVHLLAGYVSMGTMVDNREKRVIDQAVARGCDAATLIYVRHDDSVIAYGLKAGMLDKDNWLFLSGESPAEIGSRTLQTRLLLLLPDSGC